MTKKRKPITGADIFLTKKEQPNNRPWQKSSSSQTIKTSKLNDVRKERVNYYLSPELLERLDQAQAELRRLTRKKITKSEIVAVSVEETLKEFEKSPEKSRLYGVLTE